VLEAVLSEARKLGKIVSWDESEDEHGAVISVQLAPSFPPVHWRGRVGEVRYYIHAESGVR
jgi:hypothetical protein